MVELVIENLSKAFDGGQALAVNDVSLRVESGEWLTLLGPSGCGKSTTLNCVAGLEVPTGGRITLGDRTLVDGHKYSVPPESRDVGMVFQSYALWPHMTVASNVAFPLRLRGVGARQRERQVLEVLGLVELRELSDRYPHELSGGQQQRVALARALVYQPKILLLDEPLSNLDAKLRERARVWLTKLQRDLGVTTVYVTHDQVEALTMSDKIAVMNEGQLIQIGTPEEIYGRPASPFVAGFIGTSNLVQGHVVSRNGQEGTIRVAGADMTFDLPRDVIAGQDVTVAIRPEHIQVNSAAVGGEVAIKGKLVQRTYLGSKYEYLVNVDGGEMRFESATPLPEEMEDVFLVVDAGNCSVFPLGNTSTDNPVRPEVPAMS